MKVPAKETVVMSDFIEPREDGLVQNTKPPERISHVAASVGQKSKNRPQLKESLNLGHPWLMHSNITSV